MKNRSVPTDSLLAHVTYREIPEAMAWLTKTFGFAENYRYLADDRTIQGAQMHLGSAWIMLHGPKPGQSSPALLGGTTQSLTVFVDDVDAHFAHAKSSNAKIVEDLHETIYGERQYGVEDLEGHRWLFSKHVRDVDPREWGAILMGNSQ